MKKTILLLSGMFVMFCSINTNAQTASSTANASASARIVTPLEIMKTVDLAFGNIAAGPSAGTVTIATDGSRSGNGGITLIEAGNVNSAAQFAIVGYPSATFAISLPVSIDITNGTSTMAVDNFVSDLGAASTLDGNGEAGLNVGATLNVNAGQEPGLYTGSFDVTVAYN
ncbi:MAG: DUF4402 domain-containing protein [Bacteroidota bacterium]